MKIDVLCTGADHPIRPLLQSWGQRQTAAGHQARLIAGVADAAGGDLLFLISCSEIVNAEVRARYGHALVIHASDLPLGRGWSPHVWEILNGADHLTVTLLEAADKVDSGAIWRKVSVPLEGHELTDEINAKLFSAEIALMDFAVAAADTIQPVPQAANIEPTYYPRRTPAMSEIDPARPLAEQFDLLRIADPARYPAFFTLRGHRYVLKIEKAKE
ncbi:MAG: UDP-glucuronic acid dehydrogenase [Sphingomonadales bacterium]|nr:UDP-glucuronic acid dehydrogenase [Sphingomonadales bacterium]